jgi:hypothetical protein
MNSLSECTARETERIQPERQRGDGCRGLNPVTPQVNQRRNYREESPALRQTEYFQQYLRQPEYFQQYLRQAEQLQEPVWS